MNTHGEAHHHEMRGQVWLRRARLQAAGRSDAFHYAWWTCKGDIAQLEARVETIMSTPPPLPSPLLADESSDWLDDYFISYLLSLHEAIELIKQHRRLTSEPTTTVPPALLLMMWLNDGRRDAYQLVLDHYGDLTRIQNEVIESEALIADGAINPQGPMSPGASPRVHREGFLAGLRDALRILQANGEASELSLKTRTPRKATPKRRKAVAEKSTRYTARKPAARRRKP